MSDKYLDQIGLFPNKNRKTENHPAFTGDLTLSNETLGELVRMVKAGGTARLSCSAWVNPWQGQKRISVKVHPWRDAPLKQEQPKQQVNPFAESGQAETLNDDLPF